MKSIGIIAEYNPFHNGHLYHLNKIKEMFPDHIIVLILSGNFMQRGEVSIIDKYDKTKIALKNKIDLIVELPFNFATQSADIFAKGALELLNYLQVEYLVFGSENNNIDDLKTMANIQINDSNYQNKIKEYMKDGINYPTALSKALNEITNIQINTPNDILGLSYVREIMKNKYKIKPLTIKRTNNYHELNSNSEIISASNIRNKIKNKLDIKKFIPQTTYKYIPKESPFIENCFKYLKYNIINNIETLDEYLTVDEGIDNRIKKFIYTSNTYNELIENIKTKRYTYNKISRMLCHILVGYKKIDKNDDIKYLRILGMNNQGQEYLKHIKKNINIPIITKFSDFNIEQQNFELKLSYIYSLCLDEKSKDNFIQNEIKSKIILEKDID